MAGIRLIQIFEDEWIEKREIVESLLQSAIRKNGSIGARKLQVSQISAKDARRFLDKNHMQGFERAGLHLGLHLNTKIIAVASFSKPRFCDGDCELIRYASSLNVSGGLLKLIKEARSILEFKTLVSYCDMRLGTGESYIKAGFTLEGETPHDYWWFKKTKRIPRYRTQKHKLKSDPEFSNFYRDDLTEKEICSLAGYRKISGVGHKKFLLVM